MKTMFNRRLFALTLFLISFSGQCYSLVYKYEGWWETGAVAYDNSGPYGAKWSFLFDDSVLSDDWIHVIHIPLLSFEWLGRNYGDFSESNVGVLLTEGFTNDHITIAGLENGITTVSHHTNDFSVGYDMFGSLRSSHPPIYAKEEMLGIRQGVDNLGFFSFVAVDLPSNKDDYIHRSIPAAPVVSIPSTLPLMGTIFILVSYLMRRQNR